MIKTQPLGVLGGPKTGQHDLSDASNLRGKLNVHGPGSGAPIAGLPGGKLNVHGPGSGAPIASPPGGKLNVQGPVAGASAIGFPGKLSAHGPGSAQFIHAPGIPKTLPALLLPGGSFLGGGMSPGRRP
jgi:hypothetical protein